MINSFNIFFFKCYLNSLPWGGLGSLDGTSGNPMGGGWGRPRPCPAAPSCFFRCSKRCHPALDPYPHSFLLPQQPTPLVRVLVASTSLRSSHRSFHPAPNPAKCVSLQISACSFVFLAKLCDSFMIVFFFLMSGISRCQAPLPQLAHTSLYLKLGTPNFASHPVLQSPLHTLLHIACIYLKHAHLSPKMTLWNQVQP